MKATQLHTIQALQKIERRKRMLLGCFDDLLSPLTDAVGGAGRPLPFPQNRRG